jgi:5S rRNA maturation endonuclease (ribonuclease M5)
MPITHMVILTDNDQAGREAKIQIKRQFSRMYRLSFPVFKKKDVGDMQINEIKDVILGQIKGFAI